MHLAFLDNKLWQQRVLLMKTRRHRDSIALIIVPPDARALLCAADDTVCSVCRACVIDVSCVWRETSGSAAQCCYAGTNTCHPSV